MKTVIVGCGWLGQQLATALIGAGHSVVTTRRSAQACATLPTHFNSMVLDLSLPLAEQPQLVQLFHQAVVLCAIPPGRQHNNNGYVQSLQRLAELMQLAQSHAVVHFSSSGIYQGLSGDVDESCPLVLQDPRVQLLADGEQALAQFLPCVTLRLAGLMGPGRHPGRFTAGKILPEPQAPVNMLHSADICRAVLHLLEPLPHTSAVYNLSCPQRITRNDFYQQAANAAGTRLTFAGATTHQRWVDPQRFIHQYNFQYQFAAATAALAHCDPQ